MAQKRDDRRVEKGKREEVHTKAIKSDNPIGGKSKALEAEWRSSPRADPAICCYFLCFYLSSSFNIPLFFFALFVLYNSAKTCVCCT